MQRSQGLPTFSAKRLAVLEAAGVHPQSTFTTATATATARTRTKLVAARYTGPNRATVDGLFDRDHGCCAHCGAGISGIRGLHWSASHRRPRRGESDLLPDTNLPSNLVLLCGSATTLCHGRVESCRTESYGNGHLLRANEVPSQRPIEHAVHGFCYLTDDGRVEVAPPPVDRAGVLDLGGYWNPDEVA